MHATIHALEILSSSAAVAGDRRSSTPHQPPPPLRRRHWTALQVYGLILGDATGKGMALNLERTMTTAEDEAAVAGIMNAIVSNLHYVSSVGTVARANADSNTSYAAS